MEFKVLIVFPFMTFLTIFEYINASDFEMLLCGKENADMFFEELQKSYIVIKSQGCTDTNSVTSHFSIHIKNKHNGLRPTLKPVTDAASIEFKTNPRHPPKARERTRGFRTCILPFYGLISCNRRCSTMFDAFLQSTSVRGIHNHESKRPAIPFHKTFLQLMVLMFYIVSINCKSGSKITIVHLLAIGLILQNVFVEGFFWFGPEEKKVESCFDAKCYSFYLRWNSLSWTQALDICSETDGTLVSIKSQTENLAVMKGLRDLKCLFNNYAYIGLSNRRQCRTYQGNVRCDLWTDGTPVSYTAWKKYYPQPGRSSSCTIMDTSTSIEAQNSWIQADCEDPRISVYMFACEKIQHAIPLQQNLLNTIDGVYVDNEDYSHLYRCSTGEYVSPTAVCNSQAECRDLSDEIRCNSSPDKQCDLNMFMCDGGKCVHISTLCDDVKDCEDGTDEYCSKAVYPVEGRFYCNNMEDIDSSKQCDGVFDCKDESDESNCDKCNLTTSFVCDCNKCLPLRYKCDNIYDCTDKSDEASCDRRSYRLCDDVYGKGIVTGGHYKTARELEWFCDFDGVTSMVTMTFRKGIIRKRIRKNEEYELNTYDFIKPALEAEFVCFQNFTPVVRKDLTNLENVTFDTFDEALMEIDQGTNLTSYKLEHNHLRVTYVGNRTLSLRLHIHSPFNFTLYRIPFRSLICKKDMRNDIIVCGENLEPVAYAHKCMYRKDINGQIDGCRNMAHLRECGAFVCPSGYVKCPDSYCIPASYVCNMQLECPFGEDESDCCAFVCPSGYVKCPDSYCIPASYVCNMQLECPFGEDESDCWCANKEGLLFAIHNNNYDLADILLLVRMFVGVNRTVYMIQLEDNKYSMNPVSHPSIHPYMLYALKPDKNVNNISFEYIVQHNSIDIVMINLMQDEMSLVENTIIPNIKRQMTGSNVNFLRLHIDTFSLTKPLNKKTHPFKATFLNTTINEVKASTVGQILMNAHNLLGDTCPENKRNVCSGGYVCKSTKICLPLDQLCDNIKNCHMGDDEMMCNFKCPDTCTCDGLAIDCRHANITWEDISEFPTSMRSLDVSGNTALGGSYINLTKTFPYLYRLNVSDVGILGLISLSLSKLPNVQIVDLRANKLTILEKGTFLNLRKLKMLNLDQNKDLQIKPGAFQDLKVKQLSLQGCGIKVIKKETFDGLDLDLLDLSKSTIEEIENGAFQGLRTDELDITFNPIRTFEDDMFKGIVKIRKLKTSNYTFCCIKPPSLTDCNCIAPKDEFSTCADLIGNPALQWFLWLLGIFAFVGNFSSIIIRIIFDRARLKIGYGIFVTNLAISDLLMGIYMLIIAIADTMFRNRYIHIDEYWRTSYWCKLCGVLSTVSSEASVLFICLITMDRIIAIKFPFNGFKFALTNSLLVSITCWILAIFVAVYPIVSSSYFENEFYSSRAVCVALPLTRDRPPGWLYSFVIFIGFNCVAFVMIALGQVVIYSEVRRSARRQKRMNVSRSNDLSIAKSLFLVVLTDFMCWFPVGCMGYMALNDYPIPGEVYAWTVVLVMPINSAINPFLYTYSIMISKRAAKQKRETRAVDTFQRHTEIAQSLNTNTVSTFRKLGYTTLEDIMATRCLTITEITLILSEVTQYLNQVHEAGAVTTTIDPKNILVNPVNNKITRNIHVVDNPRPTLTPTDQAIDMGKIGSLASRMLKARMRQY